VGRVVDPKRPPDGTTSDTFETGSTRKRNAGRTLITQTTEAVRLPPGPRIPKIVQGIAFLATTHGMFAALGRRYGRVFTVNFSLFGQAVVISDPVLVKDVFTADIDLIERPTGAGHLGEAFGPGSTFSLGGEELLARRKLVVPPFHGKRMRSYEHIVEDEVMREVANWPQGSEFETLQPMMRMTLHVILRAVFGAQGPALDELRGLLPPLVSMVGAIAVLSPKLRTDLGPWSPGGRFLRYRRRFDAVVDSLIADARADPALEERSDVLALLIQARYDNGEPIPDRHIADELLTLVASGHETTSAGLAWSVERLRRHPSLLARLTEEVDAGGSTLRQATIWEVLRTRSVLEGTTRRTKKRIRLGDWVLPENTAVILSIRMAHASEESFSDAASFNPDRFVGVGAPKPFAWIPFGGGVNRCIGSALSNMEMDVTLRTMLRELQFAPTDAPGERRHWRGVATVPARGGRAVVYRRRPKLSGDTGSASVADHAN
jgi:cytochrome P450